jgi:two-component system response regulator HydG
MRVDPPILVVEDDADLREQLRGAFDDEGYRTVLAGSFQEGVAKVHTGDFSMVVTDLQFPDGNGLDLIRQINQEHLELPVLVITAYASVDNAVEAMRRGAFHYLAKPFSVEALLAECEKALEYSRVLKERRRLRDRLSAERGLGRIVGSSKQMAALRQLIAEVAAADAAVLITGETGTGKELVANALHYESDRAGGPLITVNCAALSETLLESELFGHEKGAFTGAEKARTGRFERADGGTLFLDEISEMGPHVQAKLLRVLQGEEFERVGGDKIIATDVRVISATNRDPQKALEDGKLRKDLFYRLNTVLIKVPPLREHMEDVPEFAGHFLAYYASRNGKRVASIADDALEALCAYEWPGNVRELEHGIERGVVLTHGEVLEKKHLPGPVSGIEHPFPAVPEVGGSLNLQEVERRTILRALAEADWNKVQAAKKLGIYHSSLYKKMKRLDIPLDPPE